MENKLNITLHENAERLTYLDIMRIFATFTVIILHASAQSWTDISINSYEWQVLSIYNSIVRFNVPLFVAISGALFLDASYKISIKKLYSKNVLRLVTAYVFWSFIYAVLTYFYNAHLNYNIIDMIIYILKATVNSHYHLWFVPMIIGVYIMIPILKPVTEHKNSKKICEYFLILFFIIGILKPSIFAFDFPYKAKLSYIANIINCPTIAGWLGYFVLGYYLRKYEIKKFYRNTTYVLGVISYIFTAVLSGYLSVKTGNATSFFTFSFSLSSFFGTAAWFIFFKYEISKIKLSEKIIGKIGKISKNMFGLYLIHAMVLKLAADFGLTPLSFNPLISVPVISLIIFAAGYILTILVSKLPIINKYIM